MRKFLILVCLLSLSAAPAQAGLPRWVGSWGAAPQPPTAASKALNNQTVRQVVRLSAGGDRVRIRFTNEYGTKPLVIGAASVAKAKADGEIAGPVRALTFGGQTSVTIPPGAPMLSDPISLKLDSLSTLSISAYFPGETGPCTCHNRGEQTAYVSEPGDFTKGPFAAKETITARAFLSGVDVETEWGKTIVVLGDSISDGYRSTVDANARWPDRLAERFAERWPKEGWGVVNMGISGNRILSGGMGDAALTRLDRDVLAVPGAAYLIVFEGVNDVGMGSRPNGGGVPSAEQMIAGYQQIIARAKTEKLKVIGATIAPFEGAAYYTEQGEAVRQQVNQWIRTSGAFDGVIDFDAAWRDPTNPKRIKADLQPGDWLHGNDAGYRVLGDAVNLKLFN